MYNLEFYGTPYGTINVFLHLKNADEIYTGAIDAVKTFLSQFDVWDGKGYYQEECLTIRWEFPYEMIDFIQGTRFKQLVMRAANNFDITFKYIYLDELRKKVSAI